MAKPTIKVVEKNEGRKIGYELEGSTLWIGDAIAMRLPRLQTDDTVKKDICVIPAGVCGSIRPISENDEDIKQNAKKFQSDSKTTRTQRRSFDYEENKRNDRIRSRLPI